MNLHKRKMLKPSSRQNASPEFFFGFQKPTLPNPPFTWILKPHKLFWNPLWIPESDHPSPPLTGRFSGKPLPSFLAGNILRSQTPPLCIFALPHNDVFFGNIFFYYLIPFPPRHELWLPIYSTVSRFWSRVCPIVWNPTHTTSQFMRIEDPQTLT